MLHILTIVYGDEYIKTFMKCLVKSLSMPKNKAALNQIPQVHWHVFTDDNSIDKVRTIIRETNPNIVPRVRSRSEARTYVDESLSAFIQVGEECIKDNARMLFAPPDIFFGDGSIPNLMKMSEDKDSVVTVAHVRSTPSIIPELNKESISNAELVRLAFKHLHTCWGDAELGHPRQNQFGTGVRWSKLDENLYSVVHRLPTPYVINLLPSDLEYFKLQAGFGHFDHKWPGEVLMHQGRHRYASSSDLAFMVEITEPHKNISNPYTLSKNPNKDDFWDHNFHNEMNKQVLITFRGE